MSKLLLLLVPLLLVAMVIFIVFGNRPSSVNNGPLKGVSFSPKSTAAADLTSFFGEAKIIGNTVTWAGDWNDLTKANGGPELVVSESVKQGLTPIIEVTAYTEKSGSLQPIRGITGSVRQSYIDAAAAFVKKHNLKYFGIGIEINRINESSVTNFNDFVRLFNDTRAAIKAASPTTEVFTVWQLEKMKGLNGGLYGGKNDTSKNGWALLSRLDQADFFAFTTYPSLIYTNPKDIPAEYYSEIKNHTIKDLAFSEIGWPSITPAKGWDSSETMQAQFITRFSELTSSLNPTFKIWSFLYDQAVANPFTTMGLISPAGVQKQAFINWRNL